MNPTVPHIPIICSRYSNLKPFTVCCFPCSHLQFKRTCSPLPHQTPSPSPPIPFHTILCDACFMHSISPASLPSTHTVDPTPWPTLTIELSSIGLEWVPPIFPHQAGDGVGQPQILLPHCHTILFGFLTPLLLGGS